MSWEIVYLSLLIKTFLIFRNLKTCIWSLPWIILLCSCYFTIYMVCHKSWWLNCAAGSHVEHAGHLDGTKTSMVRLFCQFFLVLLNIFVCINSVLQTVIVWCKLWCLQVTRNSVGTGKIVMFFAVIFQRYFTFKNCESHGTDQSLCCTCVCRWSFITYYLNKPVLVICHLIFSSTFSKLMHPFKWTKTFCT